MSAHEERRKNPRIPRDEKLFVKIVSSSHDDALTGNVTSCSTGNLSADGINIRADHAAPVGCRLDLWVTLSSRPGTFLLSGEVKWAETENDSSYFTLGIALSEQPGDDFQAWQRFMAEGSLEDTLS